MPRPALVLLIAVLAAPVGAAEVKLLDGTTLAGDVTAWDGRTLTVAAADGARDLDAAQVLDIRWTNDAPSTEPTSTDASSADAPTTAAGPALHVELIDGTRLPLAAFTAARRIATLESPSSARPLRTSAERIRRVELQRATDASRDLWRQLDEREPAGDVVLVANRDGTKLDYLTGVVGDVTADEVAFQYEGQQLNIKRSRVAGIAYYHAEQAKLADPACALTLVDGANIPARTIVLRDGELQITTPAALRLDVKLDQLARADFSAGKLAYLSDLEPVAVAWTPRVAMPAAAPLIADYGRPRFDTSFAGSPLTLAWADESSPTGREIRTFGKGVALRSRTEATWRLPEGMKRFSATAGIDPAASDQGHVVLEIRADQRLLWEGEIDGHADPVPIDVELGSARRLQIRVDYGRNLDYGDRLHLVEARVTK
jgi:hypothetical protein